MNTNINIGVCHRRIQAGEPPYFVNWTDKEGKNNYKFFPLRFMAENLKNYLKNER